MQQHRQISLEEQIANLKRLPAVPAGWSPKPPSEAVLKLASSLAEVSWREELPEPSLIATEDGGVHVKWVRGSRQVSAFIFPDTSVEYLSSENGHPVSEAGPLPDLLAWLIR